MVRLFVVNNLCHQHRFGGEFVTNESFGFHDYDPSTDGFGKVQFELQRISGNDFIAELNAVYLQEIG